MKKLSLCISTLLVTAFFTACNDSTDGSAAKTDSAKTAAGPIFTDTDLGEDFFDYAIPNDEYRYLLSERTRDLGLFKTNFKLKPNGTDPIVNTPFFLKLGAINSMITLLKGFGYDNTENFACIKMQYAMSKSNMVLLFSPVVLTPKEDGDVECTVTPSNQFFTTDADGNTTPVLDGQLTPLTNHFIDTVWIIHPNVQDNFNFIDGNFPDGDTHYTIIPIQQILAMYMDNSDAGKRTVNDKVQFDIAASNLFLETGNPANFKVHVIASFNLTKECVDDTQRFQMLAADFTQMCPPACNNVSFVPARINKTARQLHFSMTDTLFHKHIAKNEH